MVDILVVTICQVIFSADYISQESTIEYDQRLRFVGDRCAIWDEEYRRERVQMEIWIANYILPLGSYTSQIGEKSVIKKTILNFSAKFQWLVVHYRLCMTVVDNLLTWDGVALIASMMERYDINFVSIIRYKLYERAFGDMATLIFPCLVQILCDEAGVSEVQGVDKRLETTGVDQTSTIKDSTNSVLAQRTRAPLTVISAQFEGPSVSMKPIDRQGGDVSINMNFDMGEQREAPE